MPDDVLLNGHLANSYARLGNCLLESGDTKIALEYCRKALASRLKLSAKNLGGNANRGALAECYTNLGKAVAPRNREEALQHYSKAIDLLERLTIADVNNAKDRIRLADALANAARLYARMASTNNEVLSVRLHPSRTSSLSVRRRPVL